MKIPPNVSNKNELLLSLSYQRAKKRYRKKAVKYL